MWPRRRVHRGVRGHPKIRWPGFRLSTEKIDPLIYFLIESMDQLLSTNSISHGSPLLVAHTTIKNETSDAMIF